MYRVALSVLVAATVGLAGCSLNTGAISSGYNDVGDTASLSPSGRGSGLSTSSIDRSSRSSLSGGTQVAAYNPDKAP